MVKKTENILVEPKSHQSVKIESTCFENKQMYNKANETKICRNRNQCLCQNC